MQLRCKDGDLAIVIGDVRGCEGNIGRIVKVRGPSNIHPFVNKVCWKIKPISRKDYLVLELNGTLTKAQITWKDDIVHPDCWLLPIKPPIKDTEVNAINWVVAKETSAHVSAIETPLN